MIFEALLSGKVDKQQSLVLRGKLGFADSFTRGRLGALLLKRLTEHAYGRASVIDRNLKLALQATAGRLQNVKPRTVLCSGIERWFIFTDASFESSTNAGGLGGVLFDNSSRVCGWFSVYLDQEVCKLFSMDCKETIICEPEMLAAFIAFRTWCSDGSSSFYVLFGDNDSVRFSS